MFVSASSIDGRWVDVCFCRTRNYCIDSSQLDRFDARHYFDDLKAFGDVASIGSVRSEPNFGLRRDQLDELFDERYNDFGLLLEERDAATKRAQREADERAAAALATAEQERADAEARKSKVLVVLSFVWIVLTVRQTACRNWLQVRAATKVGARGRRAHCARQGRDRRIRERLSFDARFCAGHLSVFCAQQFVDRSRRKQGVLVPRDSLTREVDRIVVVEFFHFRFLDRRSSRARPSLSRSTAPRPS